jgi:hypothetical protein
MAAARSSVCVHFSPFLLLRFDLLSFLLWLESGKTMQDLLGGKNFTPVLEK